MGDFLKKQNMQLHNTTNKHKFLYDFLQVQGGQFLCWLSPIIWSEKTHVRVHFPIICSLYWLRLFCSFIRNECRSLFIWYIRVLSILHWFTFRSEFVLFTFDLVYFAAAIQHHILLDRRNIFIFFTFFNLISARFRFRSIHFLKVFKQTGGSWLPSRDEATFFCASYFLPVVRFRSAFFFYYVRFC